MKNDETQHGSLPSKGWHEVASGDIGDMLYWRPGYEILESGETAISLLENLSPQEIDWGVLLRELPRFSFLQTLDRSFSFSAWGEVDGFYVIEDDSCEETGSMSGEWTRMRLEMDHAKKTQIFHDFAVLVKRLRDYPPLSRFI